MDQVEEWRCIKTTLNETAHNEFIILGFSSLQDVQLLIFLIFLITYICTVVGNISIMTIACLDSQLHTPMYFFLGNLSFLDICYTTTNVPQMLVHLLSNRKSISYVGCVIQLYFFLSFVGTECILLATMAYDHFVAICHPLHYTVMMRKELCLQLAGASWVTIVLMYYGSSIFTYVRPISTYSLDKDRLISVLYSIVTPMLNPLIYTLRNKDIKDSLKRILTGKLYSK
ncbi:putative olfactory receptor 2W6 [Heteronotia binoei]|uniref:putative olfactory receptor 2W6 n=1 Tax=Heteronotia binoei TaxID=13085 RepID=UPI00292CED47|nr:putative olfactory receptor 2W6 [Heteronotia binoei]